MSALGYSFIGGLLEHAQALAAVTCPTVNSYKRLASAAPDSGAAWSPVFATYGGNDRTHMLRVPDPGRVEDRCIDGSANPYLAMSALDRRRPRRHRARARPGRPLRAQPARARPRRRRPSAGCVSMPMTLWHAARPPRGRRRPARRAGQDPRRRLRRLLRRHQAGRGPVRARRGHALGARPLPERHLTAMTADSDTAQHRLPTADRHRGDEP